MKCGEYGYTLSLHQEKSDPEDGYGYNHPDIPATQITLAELKKIADDWNAKGLASNATQGKWIVTVLKESPEHDKLKAFDPVKHGGEVMADAAVGVEFGASTVTAELTERYRWLSFAHLRGFVFYRNGVRLNGMITIELGDEAGVSFENDWKRYSTMNATVIYTGERDKKDNPIVDHIEWGPFSDLTKEEALGAIKAALGANS